MTPDTGQLAQIAFDAIPGEPKTTSFTARMTMIGENSRTIEALEASALDTTDEKEKVPGDLVDPGEIDCEFWWDATQSPPEPGNVCKCTVTFPLAPGQNSPGSYQASGFFTQRLTPSAQTGTLMKGKAKFTFDGRSTKFTFTPAT